MGSGVRVPPAAPSLAAGPHQADGGIAEQDVTDCAALAQDSGQGIDRLIDMVADRLERRAGSVGIAMRDRHRQALERAVGDLDAAMATLEATPEIADMVAEDLRSAIRAVDSLVGRVDVEHILDEIFSSFCIGK